MLDRKTICDVCRSKVESFGLIPEEVFGTTIFFQVPALSIARAQDRVIEWKEMILRERFSEEGLENMFEIMEELMPDVDHRGEYRTALGVITPEEREEEARRRAFDKAIERMGS